MLEKQKQKHGRCGLNSIVSVQIKIGSGKLTFFERPTLSNAQNVLQYVGAPPEANYIYKVRPLDEIALCSPSLRCTPAPVRGLQCLFSSPHASQ